LRDSFRPLKRGAFPLAVERRLAPSGQHVQALLGLPRRAGVLAVHVEAVTARVDLRRAHLDELAQGVLQPAVPHVPLERAERRDALLGDLAVLDTTVHVRPRFHRHATRPRGGAKAVGYPVRQRRCCRAARRSPWTCTATCSFPESSPSAHASWRGSTSPRSRSARPALPTASTRSCGT